MTHVRATAVAATLGLFGWTAHGQEAAWQPATVKTSAPAPTTAPMPVPMLANLPSVAVPSGAPRPFDPPVIAGQVQELSQWQPARRYPIDYPPKPASPVATPASGQVVPAPIPDAAPTFRPSTAVLGQRPAEPASAPAIQPIPSATDAAPPLPESRGIAPSVLPPLQPLPPVPPLQQPISTDLSLTDEPPTTLPAPRPTDPPTTKPVASPPPAPPVSAPHSAPSAAPSTLAIDCPPAATQVLEPLPAGAVVSAVPARGRVFGSPAINLSRDYPLRDLFGTDMVVPRRGGADGEVLGAGSGGLFVQAEVLLWWGSRARIPVLAATSASGTGTGFLGDPDTRTLLGPGTFGPSFQTGFRVRAGGMLDECGNVGVDGSFFFLGRRSETVTFDSTQYPVITRPFFAPNQPFEIQGQPVNTPGEFGEAVASPNLSSGRLTVEQDRFLWGADVNYRCAICRTCDECYGWLLGYRHLDLQERLRVTEFITATGPRAPDPVGTQVVVGDVFETRNRFHGGQVGRWWAGSYGRFDLDLRALVALGVTNSQVTVSGFQRRTRPGETTQTFTGGLLAAGPNLGTFRKSGFSVVPEVTFNVGYMLTPRLRGYVGYNFLYWSGVLRPGDQIDRTVDVTFVPNPPQAATPSGQLRPTVPFTRSDFWAQGVHLGLELRW
jgi:hypothetical protein